MGICQSERDKNENIKVEIEKKVKPGQNIDGKKMKIFLSKCENAICKIMLIDGYGTGFFTKIKFINNEILCLMTNYHVINGNLLQNNYIEININEKIVKIYLNLKRRKWTNEDLDYTCLEILKEDNLNVDSFEIEDNNYDYKNYDKLGIITIECQLNFDKGILSYIPNSKLFYHDCNTESGYSGAPILLINNFKLIGIHCGYQKNSDKNLGIYIKEILNDINKKKEINNNKYDRNLINMSNNNYIIAEFYIKDINVNTRIINSFEQI